MKTRSRLAAAALALALLAQPLAVVAECVAMPAQECPAPDMQSMHCAPPALLQALDQRECCNVQSAPAAPAKATAVAAELVAAVIPVKAAGLKAAPSPSLQLWTYHDPPKLQDVSQAQALLCVFLI